MGSSTRLDWFVTKVYKNSESELTMKFYMHYGIILLESFSKTHCFHHSTP